MSPLLVSAIVLFVSLAIFTMFFLTYIHFKNTAKRFGQKYFGTSDIEEVVRISEEEYQQTPKSLSNMEPVILNRLKHDFPSLNVNELKSIAETNIINSLNAIEQKDVSVLTNKNERVTTWVKSKIADLKKGESVHFDSIKIHKTVINKYEKDDKCATIYLQTSLEYLFKKNEGIYKKIQTRFKTEFIYIIDASKLKDHEKALGLNCPNCGAPIIKLGNKKCVYCDTHVEDIVNKTWNINNIEEY